MYHFSLQQRHRALTWLSLFHIIVIISSNYLVQLPVVVFGLNTTWGAFSYPFIFLTTDLTVRIFGAPLARRIIFCVMLPALILSYYISVLFYQGSWQGLAAVSHFNQSVMRIACASFMAYALGQILDISVFNWLRQNKAWWVAPSASAIFGNACDSTAFFTIAFYKTQDPFMAAHWVEAGIVDYGFKILVNLVFFLPAYGMLLNMLLKRLDKQQTPWASYSH